MPGKLHFEPDREPDYVLLVSDLTFIARSFYPMHEQLQMTGSYVMLEYRSNIVVAYGHLLGYGTYNAPRSPNKDGELASDSRRPYMLRGAWKYLLDLGSVQVIHYTPFQGEAAKKYLNNWKGVW
jgi:hypothetical protein